MLYPDTLTDHLHVAKNFYRSFLWVVFVPSGCMTQLMVALRSLSNEGDTSKPSSLQTIELHATWICSSLLMSAETVRIPASP